MPVQPSTNPLLSDSADAWTDLIEAVGPASLLVVIGQRMSPALRARLAPEDVLQEALLHAWRDRARCTWAGVPAFRRWLLAVIEHRLLDLSDEAGRKKRGGGAPTLSIDDLRGDDAADGRGFYAGPTASTTPSRALSDRETAAAMSRALSELPDDVRDVLRLRLFEDLTMEEVAARLGLGVSGARHRMRKGAQLYQRRLAELLGAGSSFVARSP